MRNDCQNKLQNLSQDYLCMKNMNDKEHQEKICIKEKIVN